MSINKENKWNILIILNDDVLEVQEATEVHHISSTGCV